MATWRVIKTEMRLPRSLLMTWSSSIVMSLREALMSRMRWGSMERQAPGALYSVPLELQ